MSVWCGVDGLDAWFCGDMAGELWRPTTAGSDECEERIFACFNETTVNATGREGTTMLARSWGDGSDSIGKESSSAFTGWFPVLSLFSYFRVSVYSHWNIVKCSFSLCRDKLLRWDGLENNVKFSMLPVL